MKTTIQTLLLVSFLFFFACEEENEIVGFTVSSGEANEGDGIQSVTLNLGKRTTSSTTITYRIGGSAALDGDYTMESNTTFFTTSAFTLTIPEGESTATLTFNLIDDTQVEPRNEVIYFEITGVTDSDLSASLNQGRYTFEIIDNDSSPVDGLQVDLSWNLGDGVSINAANFDLYLARDLTVDENGEVSTYELVDNIKGVNLKGFESYQMTDDIPDDAYYIIIRFVSGTTDANVSLNFAQNNQHGSAAGRISTENIGKDIYYGPVTKNGTSFAFR